MLTALPLEFLDSWLLRTYYVVDRYEHVGYLLRRNE